MIGHYLDDVIGAQPSEERAHVAFNATINCCMLARFCVTCVKADADLNTLLYL